MLQSSVLLEQRMLSLQLCPTGDETKRSNRGSWVGCHGSREERGDVNVHADEVYC